jgi:hypothetical protein
VGAALLVRAHAGGPGILCLIASTALHQKPSQEVLVTIEHVVGRKVRSHELGCCTSHGFSFEWVGQDLEKADQRHCISGREKKAGLPGKYRFGSIANVAENDWQTHRHHFQCDEGRRFVDAAEDANVKSARVRSYVFLVSGKNNVLQNPLRFGVLLNICLRWAGSYKQGFDRIPSTSEYSDGVDQLAMIFLRTKPGAQADDIIAWSKPQLRANLISPFSDRLRREST